MGKISHPNASVTPIVLGLRGGDPVNASTHAVGMLRLGCPLGGVKDQDREAALFSSTLYGL